VAERAVTQRKENTGSAFAKPLGLALRSQEPRMYDPAKHIEMAPDQERLIPRLIRLDVPRG
jgi:hypothetical protein